MSQSVLHVLSQFSLRSLESRQVVFHQDTRGQTYRCHFSLASGDWVEWLRMSAIVAQRLSASLPPRFTMWSRRAFVVSSYARLLHV